MLQASLNACTSTSAHPPLSAPLSLPRTALPLYSCLGSQVAAVRPAAGDGIAALLRTTWREKYRSEVFLRVVREFARGRSYTQRMAFCDVLAGLVRRYSARWVKEYAFDLCLELLYDPVPNVRMQIVALLPALKQVRQGVAVLVDCEPFGGAWWAKEFLFVARV